MPWVLNGVWMRLIRECREILDGSVGGCFAVLTERWNQLLFGFSIPVELYWRPLLAFVLLFVAASPRCCSSSCRADVLIFTGLYPFLAYWLIWGGDDLVPILALAGLIVGYLALPRW
jgi:general L-amino acid transport system permease protein